MTRRQHILNVLREFRKGDPREGEGIQGYLNRIADVILGYIPGEEEVAYKLPVPEDELLVIEPMSFEEGSEK